MIEAVARVARIGTLCCGFSWLLLGTASALKNSRSVHSPKVNEVSRRLLGHNGVKGALGALDVATSALETTSADFQKGIDLVLSIMNAARSDTNPTGLPLDTKLKIPTADCNCSIDATVTIGERHGKLVLKANKTSYHPFKKPESVIKANQNKRRTLGNMMKHYPVHVTAEQTFYLKDNGKKGLTVDDVHAILFSADVGDFSDRYLPHQYFKILRVDSKADGKSNEYLVMTSNGDGRSRNIKVTGRNHELRGTTIDSFDKRPIMVFVP